jgi:protein CMS1
LEAFAGEGEKLDEAPKKLGSPHTLIVAGAGLRAADLVRYEIAESHGLWL